MRTTFLLGFVFISGASGAISAKAADNAPSPGTIIASFAQDPPFCESFIYHRSSELPPSYDRLLEDREGFGDFLLPTQGGKRPPVIASRDGNTYHVDFDNDGRVDEVLWGHGENHYFSGDYFVILPSDPQLTARLRADTDDDADVDIDEAVAWAKSNGLSVYAGDDTPYRRVRYTHFIPVVVKGETLLWAIPDNDALKPTALLYRPRPRGILERVCEYQRVEGKF